MSCSCLQVADIFSEVYHLQCNIESITTVTEAAADDPMTSVLSHFVDVDLQQPVLSSVIEGYLRQGLYSLT